MQKISASHSFFIQLLVPALLLHACGKPTYACFSYSPVSLTTTTDVTFDAGCSEMTSFYGWDFGDGSRDSVTSELSITHRYTSPGTYTVTLDAKRKDQVGFVSKGKPTESQTIVVQ